MFTCVAYFENVDLLATWTKIAAVADQHIKTSGDSVYVSGYNRFFGGVFGSIATAIGCRIVAPSIRRLAPNNIAPINLDDVLASPINHSVDPSRMLNLEIDEQLEFEGLGAAAGADDCAGVLWLADAELSQVSGQIFTARATVTLAGSAGAWEYADLAFEEDLPVGTYDVVGLDMVALNGICARLVPVGAPNRPGGIIRGDQNDIIINNVFRRGQLGVWCTFPHNNIPGLEVFSSTAIGAGTYPVLLDLIKRS